MTEEPSKVRTATMIGKDVARRHYNGLKADLEKLDAAAALVVTELNLEGKMLPRNAYIGAPGTYARHVYNVLRDVAGR